jgi:hypothetical protein
MIELAERLALSLRRQSEEKAAEIRAGLEGSVLEAFDAVEEAQAGDRMLYWEAVERRLVDELRDVQQLLEALVQYRLGGGMTTAVVDAVLDRLEAPPATGSE